jgi:carbon storage regulator
MAMLVLSRKKNESIVINNDITIVVVEIRGDKVRLGIEAPKEVPVHRQEVYDAIHRNVGIGESNDADANGSAGGA